MNRLLPLRAMALQQTRPFAATLVLSIVGFGAGVALLGVSGWFITGAALTTAAAAFNLFAPSALVRGLSLMRIVSRYGERIIGHDGTLRLLTELREWLFRLLPPRVPFSPGVWRRGDLLSRLTADIDALDAAFLTAIGPALTAAVLGAALAVLLAILLPAAAPLFALGFMIVAGACPLWLVVAGRRDNESLAARRASMRAAALEAIDGHADLISFDQVAEASKDFERLAASASETALRQARRSAALVGAAQAIQGFSALAILWKGLDAHSQGLTSAPVLVGLLLAALGCFEAAITLVRAASRFGGALASAARLQGLAATPPPIVDAAAFAELPQGGPLTFENVSFRRQADRSLIRNLDLVIRDGERVAIVGESGSGKSTLLDLALRLADVDDGSVKVAGVDVRCVAQEVLHRRIALLSQSTPVFIGSVRDNLLIGRADADDDALWCALKSARLADHIAALDKGLDTWLGEGGRTLSMGQARRLCLARTLLSPARILLLDEPTAGLDHDAEQALLADLGQAVAGRTMLLVTHAIPPRGAVDRVLCLANGRLSAINDQRA